MGRIGGGKGYMMGDHGCWATPDFLADACVIVLKRAGFFDHMAGVLDPSAGDGAIIRAILGCGIPSQDIYWIEKEDRFARNIPKEASGIVSDFLQPGFTERYLCYVAKEGLRILGNPPYPNNQGEWFVQRAKAFANRFAFLLPFNHLEPAETRWTTSGVNTPNRHFFPDYFDGLIRVYPIRRVRYRDMTGQKNGAGSRPVALFVWDTYIANSVPVIDWALHRECERLGYGRSK
jgi:hypothetical protein